MVTRVGARASGVLAMSLLVLLGACSCKCAPSVVPHTLHGVDHMIVLMTVLWLLHTNLACSQNAVTLQLKGKE